jgi:hypothetical protein
MSFHVEVRQGFRRASAFNLDEQKLRRTVIDPWRSGGPLLLGDREWDPQASTLKILQGPELSAADLAFGRGWQNAERSAKEVTESVISVVARQAATVCVLAASPSAEAALADSLRQLAVKAVDWAAVRERILSAVTAKPGRPLARIELVAALLAVDEPDPPADWLFEAGLALGALGRRAVILEFGDDPLPPRLAEVGAIQIDMRKPASLEALAQCLRAAGYPL